MTDRATRPLVIFAAFAGSLAIGLLVVLWLAGGFGNVAKPAAIGGAFQLTDQSGQTVTEKSLQGRPTIIFFGYTHCPDVCPTSLFEMSEVLRAMGKDADRVNAYFISVDPDRDTAAVMKDYLSSFDPHLKGLTGDAAMVSKVLTEFRVYAKKVPSKDGGDYTMDHTASVLLLNSKGDFFGTIAYGENPDNAVAKLKRLAAEG